MNNADTFGTEEENARVKEMAEYAGELVKKYPEVTLRSWAYNYHNKGGEWLTPGVSLELAGPKIAINAFLARLAIVYRADHFQTFQTIDPETGRGANTITAKMSPSKVQ